jgi:hypothetical protein
LFDDRQRAQPEPHRKCCRLAGDPLPLHIVTDYVTITAACCFTHHATLQPKQLGRLGLFFAAEWVQGGYRFPDAETSRHDPCGKYPI